MKKKHVKRLRNGKCNTKIGFLWQDVMMYYRRIFDHYENIAISYNQNKETTEQ